VLDSWCTFTLIWVPLIVVPDTLGLTYLHRKSGTFNSPYSSTHISSMIS
jgi:hypothetical protein